MTKFTPRYVKIFSIRPNESLGNETIEEQIDFAFVLPLEDLYSIILPVGSSTTEIFFKKHTDTGACTGKPRVLQTG